MSADATTRVWPVSRPPWLMASSAKWAVIPLESSTKVLMVGIGHHSTGMVPCGGHPKGHRHGPGCGHEAVPHGDHTDYLVGGHLHHPHGDHCDTHGPVQTV